MVFRFRIFVEFELKLNSALPHHGNWKLLGSPSLHCTLPDQTYNLYLLNRSARSTFVIFMPHGIEGQKGHRVPKYIDFCVTNGLKRSNAIYSNRCVRLACKPTSQQYCSLILNQHQPPATSQSAVLFSHNKSASPISYSQANTVIVSIFQMLFERN